MTAAVPRRIALVVHPTRSVERALATLEAWADGHGVAIVQPAVPGANQRELAPAGEIAEGDLIVALGGDGTVLAALRAATDARMPVLGVACGSLGALSAVTADELETALARVWAGEWTARRLPALAVAADAGEPERAVNDFVVVRRGAGQLVVELSIDDERYVRLAGDGLIVATPAGSTAYSMAAGGPILAADAAAFVCTPLAMHGGSAPPIVVGADATVTLEVEPNFAGFDAEIDGHRRAWDARHFRITMGREQMTLVTLHGLGHGLAGLRKRGLITDSPRVLARDARAGR